MPKQGNSLPIKIIADEPGKIKLSWETFDYVFNVQCFGCDDSFAIGEETFLLIVNKSTLRMHPSCVEQITGILGTFLDASQEARDRIIARQN